MLRARTPEGSIVALARVHPFQVGGVEFTLIGGEAVDSALAQTLEDTEVLDQDLTEDLLDVRGLTRVVASSQHPAPDLAQDGYVAGHGRPHGHRLAAHLFNSHMRRTSRVPPCPGGVLTPHGHRT